MDSPPTQLKRPRRKRPPVKVKRYPIVTVGAFRVVFE